MNVDSKQSQSFLNATGVSMDNMALVIASLIVVAYFLWSAWVTLSYYEQWASKKNNISLYDVLSSAVRSVTLLSIILYIVS
ncbi:MAG TPA: TIGR03758 family integrating conjugative element protein [Methylophaga aminisulfidivorans]|uniref:TIGR03758 family integrating conjugative element protein n=2 Tax=root TaxID=1 RepID=A0A7C1ZW06_9GAMM|nr:TIGR03758 family integrating conjugative element protein [Methylophaga sp.]HEC74270.1 TIGR03758 family integrating conjugative element protein [Methylophaga aminisulfidivorans]